MNEDELKGLLNEIREVLKHDLEMSGSVFYSGPATLCKGPFYLMGLNPGGGQSDPKIGELLSEWLHPIRGAYWSAYCDEYWGRANHSFRDYGKARHQRGVRKLCFEYLGVCVRRVLSANAIFVRSRGADGVAGADPDWAVHTVFLKIVQPEVIICLGNGPDSSFEKLRAWSKFEGVVDESKFLWGKVPRYIRWFQSTIEACNSRLILVIGVPHPSWFDLESRSFGEAWLKFVNILMERNIAGARYFRVLSNMPHV